MAFIKVMSLDDLWQGEMIGCVLDNVKLLVVRIEQDVYAYEDRCAHLGVAMSAGKLEGEVLTCSAHHYKYDVRSGKGINPRSVCLRRFPVRIIDGSVLVDVAMPLQSELQEHSDAKCDS
jgi:toluene monooxygenase system ferredoxin subunit